MVATPPRLLSLFKPSGPSSQDYIYGVKRLIPKKSTIGHFGTLDPFASGVLLVAFGQATRLNDLVHELYPKRYIAIGKLGKKTITGDKEGEVTAVDESPYLKNEIAKLPITFLQDHLSKKFLGEYWQAPPYFSASKFQGKALHEWARSGVYVDKEPVRREIYYFKVLKYKFPYFIFEVESSSGTYIRTLFEDIARELGTVGHLIGLTRSSIGPFEMKSSFKGLKNATYEDIKRRATRPDQLIPLNQFILTEKQENSLLHGAPIDLYGADAVINERVWAINKKGELIGLAKKENAGLYAIVNFSDRVDWT